MNYNLKNTLYPSTFPSEQNPLNFSSDHVNISPKSVKRSLRVAVPFPPRWNLSSVSPCGGRVRLHVGYVKRCSVRSQRKFIHAGNNKAPNPLSMCTLFTAVSTLKSAEHAHSFCRCVCFDCFIQTVTQTSEITFTRRRNEGKVLQYQTLWHFLTTQENETNNKCIILC